MEGESKVGIASGIVVPVSFWNSGSGVEALNDEIGQRYCGCSGHVLLPHMQVAAVEEPAVCGQ